jgi:hypothetical protein
VSLSGDRFFYPNTLACDMAFPFNLGSFERQPWFSTSCCPPNVVRFLPSIAGFVYGTRGPSDLYVNLYQTSDSQVPLGDRPVGLAQETRYPWDGGVRLTVRPDAPRKLALHLRIPSWVRGEVLPSDLYRYADPAPADWTLAVNGAKVEPRLEKGFAVIERQWQPGDVVELTLGMPVRRVLCNEQVEDNRGRVAIERGPIVYCAEGADQDGKKVLDRILPDDARLTPAFQSDLLGGITVLTAENAQRAIRGPDGQPATETLPLTLIPYYAWCHRGANEMAVWLPRTLAGARVPPVPTTATAARPSASHCWHLDTVAAINDGLEPSSSKDHEIPRLTWWDRRGTTEWAQLDLARPTQVHAVDVYWFDDTGIGACRLPKAWRVLARHDGAWKPVAPRGPAGIRKDAFSRLEFEPVTTDALRIEADLQPEVSGGILEVKVD